MEKELGRSSWWVPKVRGQLYTRTAPESSHRCRLRRLREDGVPAGILNSEPPVEVGTGGASAGEGPRVLAPRVGGHHMRHLAALGREVLEVEGTGTRGPDFMSEDPGAERAGRFFPGDGPGLPRASTVRATCALGCPSPKGTYMPGCCRGPRVKGLLPSSAHGPRHTQLEQKAAER